MAPELRAARAHAVQQAALAALAYSDVFAWPLTLDEIRAGAPLAVTPAEVDDAVVALTRAGVVSTVDGFVVLGDRPSLVAERRRREALSARVWKRARRAGTVVGWLPFVQFVAVSGSLAVNGAGERDDIDLFVVAAPGRLWTARAMILAVARAFSLTPARRARLCPNYLVASTHLAIAEHDVFTAHELANLVALAGNPGPLWAANPWVADFLPNRLPANSGAAPARETASLSTPSAHTLVDRFERWEMSRKVRRLRAAAPTAEARYDANVCKGHVDGHHARILAAYDERRVRWRVTL